MPYHGARTEARTSRQGLWLALGLGAILVAYPLGLVLVMFGAPDVWTPIFVVLTVAAIVAAVAFGRNQRRRHVHPP